MKMLVKVSKTHTLQRRLESAGIDSMADNLRGLTEEEAERAISQALVARYCALSGDRHGRAGGEEVAAAAAGDAGVRARRGRWRAWADWTI